MYWNKKLSVATIFFCVKIIISTFWLNLITANFVLIGSYCGVSAFLCIIIYSKLRVGKKLNLIWLGLIMLYLGLVFLIPMNFSPVVNILLSAPCVVAGLIFITKGIKNRTNVNKKPASNARKQVNYKIFIGVGLLVWGVIASIILFTIEPQAMGIGYAMVTTGIIILIHGIPVKKNTSNIPKILKPTKPSQPVQSKKNVKSSSAANNTTQIPPKICARCSKNLTYSFSGPIFTIDGEVYCRDCKALIDRNVKNQHTLCHKCGIDFPLKNMHAIDNKLLCHDCFLQTYVYINLDYEEEKDQ